MLLAASVLVVTLAFLSISCVGAETRSDDEGGVGESGQGSALLRELFQSATAHTTEDTRQDGIIFSNPSLEFGDTDFKATARSTLQDIRGLPEVTAAVSYYDTEDPTMLSDDGNAVLAAVIMKNPEGSDGEIEAGPFGALYGNRPPSLHRRRRF